MVEAESSCRVFLKYDDGLWEKQGAIVARGKVASQTLRLTASFLQDRARAEQQYGKQLLTVAAKAGRDNVFERAGSVALAWEATALALRRLGKQHIGHGICIVQNVCNALVTFAAHLEGRQASLSSEARSLCDTLERRHKAHGKAKGKYQKSCEDAEVAILARDRALRSLTLATANQREKEEAAEDGGTVSPTSQERARNDIFESLSKKLGEMGSVVWDSLVPGASPAGGGGSGTAQLARLHERAQDALVAVHRAESIYAECIRCLNDELETYHFEMAANLVRFEELEMQRLDFFKSVMSRLNLAQGGMLEKIEDIVAFWRTAAESIDPQGDALPFKAAIAKAEGGATQEGGGKDGAAAAATTTTAAATRSSSPDGADAGGGKSSSAGHGIDVASQRAQEGVRSAQRMCNCLAQLVAVEQSFGKALLKSLWRHGYTPGTPAGKGLLSRGLSVGQLSAATLQGRGPSVADHVAQEGYTLQQSWMTFVAATEALREQQEAMATHTAEPVCVMLSQLQEEHAATRKRLVAAHDRAVKERNESSSVFTKAQTRFERQSREVQERKEELTRAQAELEESTRRRSTIDRLVVAGGGDSSSCGSSGGFINDLGHLMQPRGTGERVTKLQRRLAQARDAMEGCKSQFIASQHRLQAAKDSHAQDVDKTRRHFIRAEINRGVRMRRALLELLQAHASALECAQEEHRNTSEGAEMMDRDADIEEFISDNYSDRPEFVLVEFDEYVSPKHGGLLSRNMLGEGIQFGAVAKSVRSDITCRRNNNHLSRGRSMSAIPPPSSPPPSLSGHHSEPETFCAERSEPTTEEEDNGEREEDAAEAGGGNADSAKSSSSPSSFVDESLGQQGDGRETEQSPSPLSPLPQPGIESPACSPPRRALHAPRRRKSDPAGIPPQDSFDGKMAEGGAGNKDECSTHTALAMASADYNASGASRPDHLSFRSGEAVVVTGIVARRPSDFDLARVEITVNNPLLDENKSAVDCSLDLRAAVADDDDTSDAETEEEAAGPFGSATMLMGYVVDGASSEAAAPRSKQFPRDAVIFVASSDKYRHEPRPSQPGHVDEGECLAEGALQDEEQEDGEHAGSLEVGSLPPSISADHREQMRRRARRLRREALQRRHHRSRISQGGSAAPAPVPVRSSERLEQPGGVVASEEAKDCMVIDNGGGGGGGGGRRMPSSPSLTLSSVPGSEELALFGHRLPEDEKLVESFSCAEAQIVLPLSEIEKVERRTTVFVVPNAIVVVGKRGEKFFFSNFIYRDECYERVSQLVAINANLADMGLGIGTNYRAVGGDDNGGGDSSSSSVLPQTPARRIAAIDIDASPLREVQRPMPPPDAILQAGKMEVIVDTILDVSVAQMFVHLWGPNATFSFGDFLAEIGDDDISMEEWHSGESCFCWGMQAADGESGGGAETLRKETFQHTRKISYRHHREGIMQFAGPRTASTLQQQYYNLSEDGDKVVIAMNTQFEGIPMCDHFAVESRWVISHVPPPSGREGRCSVKVGVFVNFLKSTLLRGRIKSFTLSETKGVYETWIEASTSHLNRLRRTSSLSLSRGDGVGKIEGGHAHGGSDEEERARGGSEASAASSVGSWSRRRRISSSHEDAGPVFEERYQRGGQWLWQQHVGMALAVLAAVLLVTQLAWTVHRLGGELQQLAAQQERQSAQMMSLLQSLADPASTECTEEVT